MRPLVLSLLAVLGACAPGAPPPAPPRYHVAGGALRDPEGRVLVLRGANVADAHKRAPYFGFHAAEDFARLADGWGMNSVRLLTTWAAIEPERGRYDEAYLDALAARVDWAAAAGLLVIVDMHQDVYGEGFGFDGAPRWSCDEARYAAFVRRDPWFFSYLDENVAACVDDFYTSPELQAHFVEAWRRVARRLAGTEGARAVLGFDALNEPHWGSYAILEFEYDRLAPLYGRVVEAVRAEAPGWIAFLEPGASRNAGIPTGLEPFPFGDVVYAPHAYDTGAEGGGGFDDRRRALLLEHVARLRAEADRLGAALWIGEYGGVADHPGIGAYMDAAYDAAAAARAGSAYWEYGRNDGYGMLRPDGSEKPELVAALVRPWPERVAGELAGWSYDETARRLELAVRPDPMVTAPTVIVVPERLYPDGFRVTCPGCALERTAGRVAVRAPDGATDLRIDVAPE